MNRQLMLLTLGFLLSLSAYQPILFSKHFKPIQGLHIVKPLPSDMVAGSIYNWTISFINPKSDKGYANTILEVTEEKTFIGFGEFRVEGFLEAYDILPRKHYYITMKFAETNGGIFQVLQTPIEKRFNRLTLKIVSVPNLMPGKYTFILNITISY